jgi:DHA2 family multidrug resistance protein
MDKALGIQNSTIENVVLLASRLLLAWIFVHEGVFLATNFAAASAGMAKAGVPALALVATIGLQLVAGIAIALGWHARLGAAILGLALATLSPAQRTEGAGLYSLSRNIGSSVGISVVNALLTRNTQINHADIVEHVTAVNRAFESPVVMRFWNPLDAAGRAALDAMRSRRRSSPTSTITSC